MRHVALLLIRQPCSLCGPSDGPQVMQTTATTPSESPQLPARLKQLDLFQDIVGAYLDGEPKTNDELYDHLLSSGAVSSEEMGRKAKVGVAGVEYNVTKRQCRWLQMTLRDMGVIERVPDSRGTWRLAARSKDDLTRATPGVTMLGFSTRLGMALWGSCNDVFGSLTESIGLVLTSPPYALAQPRAYGNVSQDEWVDWLCKCLEPLVKRLAPGGSVALNVSQDLFVPGMPSRTLLVARLQIALCERLGLHAMDTIIWASNKPPGPAAWASKKRVQLNVGYEPVLVFCNDPLASTASNQRVLQPHSERHLKLIGAGGEKRTCVNSDGAYRIRPGSYGKVTEGRIPTNVLYISNNCADQRRMRRKAKAAGLPVHGASFPLALALFLVKFLSRPGDLVVDPFGGSMTTAKACEQLGRLWLSSEIHAEYILAARFRFDEESLALPEDYDLRIAA